ncbi:unnamed protein product [Diatraea saccharalis]|uniref:Uncharacterized protein n=1 Tax=Diatraea saccharalis TaxID=40085 RepID=A0A9N9WE63_9NEOP|nr:unnamed protein product [Diatraea saccharalis]
MDKANGKINERNNFSVILRKKNGIKTVSNLYSLANSSKPLTFFAALFGMQMLRYSKRNVSKVNLFGKFYCLLIAVTLILLIVLITPFSWRYTKADLPLNMLTKSYSVFHTTENILREPLHVERNKRRYSWFELMQVYNKVADSIFIFDKIYSGQYLEVMLSDNFMYMCLNGRPMYLTKISEMFMEERKKTLAILTNHLVRGNLDEEYSEQVERMIDLVETRRLEITGKVFTVDAHNVMNFSGRVISYAVLMIQYFYMYIFKK